MKLQLSGTGVLAIVGVAVAGLVLWRAKGAVSSLADGVGRTVADVAGAVGTAMNPTSPDNLAYRGVSAAGGAIVTDPAGPGKNADGSWSLGGFVYDVFHDDPVTSWTPPPSPSGLSWSTQGGQFNNPSAYVAPTPAYSDAGPDYAIPGMPDYFAP